MSDQPHGRVRVEDCAKRVRCYLDGALVADSRHTSLVWEIPYYPTYYFPAADVVAKLEPIGALDHSPSRGDGEILDVRAGESVAPGAGRRYPNSPIEELRDLVRFEWSALSEWFEEDEPVYFHARDPYARIDILASTRHVVVEVDGTVVADSHQPKILFETGLPARYYLPLTDYRMELLRPSTLETQCPYKGRATYFAVVLGDVVHENVIWVYRSPFPESQKIAGFAAPYNEKLDLTIDGVREARPRTHFG
jgi:uncharacterized protein (DUF427 family)